MKMKKWMMRGCAAILLLCLVLTGISVLINRNLPTESSEVASLSDLEKARLAEFIQVRQVVGGKVWPGWDTAVIPIIVYNEAYAFLLGYADPPAGWIQVPQNRSHGTAWELVPDELFNGEPYFRQRLPANGDTPQAFTVRVGEQWVTSMTTMEWMEISLTDQFRSDLPSFLAPVIPYRLLNTLFIRGSEGYISLLAHESFHAYQGSLAPEKLAAAENAAPVGETGYPWDDASFQAAWQTELDILAEAVQADSDEAMAELAREFLAQRAQRQAAAGLSEALIRYEQQREWVEGLARYVELEIWQQAALDATYTPVAALQDDGDFSGYGTFNQRWNQEVGQIGRMADDVGDGRFYYSGMAQTVMLDHLLPGWKDQVWGTDVFLDDLLAGVVE